MKFTSSRYLALAIFPAPFAARNETVTGTVARAAALAHDGDAPLFPPVFLVLLGAVFLLAGGDVSLSLGLILAALVWFGLLLVVELRGAPIPRPEGR